MFRRLVLLRSAGQLGHLPPLQVSPPDPWVQEIGVSSASLVVHMVFLISSPIAIHTVWSNPAISGGDVAQLVEHRTGTQSTQVWIPGEARDFSPRVSMQCRLSYGVRTPPCAIECIYICAHVKDPRVHVRVRWIMETLTHSACTVGMVARLCHSWLFPGKAVRISYDRNPIGTLQLWKVKIL